LAFVFYDVETTGLRRGFDHILEFAAVHTDSDLQVLDRFETRCRLLPHIIPAPKALHITGASIADLIDGSRLSHYEMITQLRARLSVWCPAMFLGFNSLHFDEEFLRQAFYQCLYYPYLTNTNGSARGDVLSLCRITASQKPNVLVPHVDAEGRNVFRLADLARANGIAMPTAHVAMADVEATLALCRIVQQGAPEVWSRFLRFSQRAAVEAFINDEDAFVLFETLGNQPEVRIVTRIGEHNEIRTRHYCLDLRIDLNELRVMDFNDLVALLKQHPRPIAVVRTNAAPAICPLYDATTEQLGEMTEADISRIAREVRDDRNLIAKLRNAAQDAERVYAPSSHVEEQLYGYPATSPEDTNLMAEFHASTWETRSQLPGHFTDQRYQRLARRLIYFERPDLLSSKTRDALDVEIGRRLSEESLELRPWLSLPTAIQEADSLLAEVGSAEERTRVQNYANYLRSRLTDLTTT
jgi:exodeoxyribonuclease-1